MAATFALDNEKGDFCNTFLNGILEDTIYMEQPEGYVQNSISPTNSIRNYICHLHKSLYGLKQATRMWYACLHQCLSSFGKHRVSSDQAMWILHHLALLGHVDDVLIIGNSNSLRSYIRTQYRPTNFVLVLYTRGSILFGTDQTIDYS